MDAELLPYDVPLCAAPGVNVRLSWIGGTRIYVNIFRSYRRADIDAGAYASDAARMEQLARRQKGFVSFKSFVADDGEKLSMSEWETEEDAVAWARHGEHRAAQSRGRTSYYERYVVYSCATPAIRHFPGN